MANMAGQAATVGIVGPRSFISQALVRELDSRGIGHRVIPKELLDMADMSTLDCVYLVLGRARPTSDEEVAEREQLVAFLNNPRLPRRVVYLSSRRLTESKRWCEDRIRMHRAIMGESMLVHVLRPPAVFGPNQSLDSDMLVPSLARTKGSVPLFCENQPTSFISVNDLARHLANFSDLDWYDFDWCGDPESSSDIPGTFMMSPHEMRELYLTFEGLSRVQRDSDARQAFLAGVECAESGEIAGYGDWAIAADAFMRGHC